MSKIIFIIFSVGVLLLGYYAVIFEPNNIKIEKQVITIKNLPPSFDGIKIVQLSDFHSLWFGSRERKVLVLLEKLNPDFIFITGDFVDPLTKLITDKEFKSVRVFWQELGKRYKNRIFGVLGNHDSALVKNLLKESGITILDNKRKKLTLDKEFIFLIGIGHPWMSRNNLSKVMAGIEEEKPKILLAHGPEIIEEAKKEKIDLVLVGHTHGGQVNIPILGKLIQPLSEEGRRYTRGLFKLNSTYLYVNRGVGTSFFPVRFNCPPEITLITLQK